MNKNRKLGWKLQLFAQTWSPDKVTVFEHKDGTIPEKYQNMILKEVMENSKVMRLAKYERWIRRRRSLSILQRGRALTG